MSVSRTINDDLHKDLQVQPLKEGEVAIFRLIRAGIFDPMTGRPCNPASHTIPGVEVIQDPFNKRSVRIFNITDHIPIEREGLPTSYKVNYAAVTFDATATITCNSDKNDLYMFLMRSSYNRDNKYRSRKYAPLFYRVDTERDARVSVDYTEYKRLALNIVADLKDKELVALGHELQNFNINIDLNKKGIELRRSLNIIAESQSEKLILASDDNMSKTRVYIDRAIDQMVIIYNPDKRKWFWAKAPDGGELKKDITVIGEGNDPKSGLIDFLCNTDKKGSDHRAELVTRVSKEETYQAPESKTVAAPMDIVKNYVKGNQQRVKEIAGDL